MRRFRVVSLPSGKYLPHICRKVFIRISNCTNAAGFSFISRRMAWNSSNRVASTERTVPTRKNLVKSNALIRKIFRANVVIQKREKKKLQAPTKHLQKRTRTSRIHHTSRRAFMVRLHARGTNFKKLGKIRELLVSRSLRILVLHVSTDKCFTIRTSRKC